MYLILPIQCTYGFLAPGSGNDETPFWGGRVCFIFPTGLDKGIPFPIFFGRGSSFLAASANPLKPKPRCLPGPPLLNIVILIKATDTVVCNLKFVTNELKSDRSQQTKVNLSK